MREVLLVACAGALGALGRWGVSEWARRSLGEAFPYGTLLVNVVGSLLLGFVAGLALGGAIAKPAKLAIGTGFCGALTTFSTFSVETVALLEEDKAGHALASVGANLALGMLGAWIGLVLARRFNGEG